MAQPPPSPFVAMRIRGRHTHQVSPRGGGELEPTDYTHFLADEFDAGIVYGPPPSSCYGPVHRSVVLLFGTETVTPPCAPALAERIRAPANLLAHPLIGSDNKRVRWPNWFAANSIVAPEPRGPRLDRNFLSLSAAADGLGVAFA